MKASGIYDEKERDILHLAPDSGLAQHLSKRFGDGYDPRDLEPQRYPFVSTLHLNLCDIALDGRTYDCILHNHVLEHIPCDPIEAVLALDQALKPGGIHIFTIPIRTEFTEEGRNLTLTPEERLRHFGQEDHVRNFGRVDFPRELANRRNQKSPRFPMLARYTPADLDRWRLPIKDYTEYTSGTTFFYRRPWA